MNAVDPIPGSAQITGPLQQPNRFSNASFQNLITRTLAADQHDRPVGTRYLKAAAILAVITGVGIAVDPWVAPTNVAMLYLLATVFASFKWGMGPILAASRPFPDVSGDAPNRHDL